MHQFLAAIIPGRWSRLGALFVVTTCASAQTPTKKLAEAIDQYEKKQYAVAVRQLKPLKQQLPKLGDYVSYYSAAAQAELKEFQAVRTDLSPLLAFPRPSPLTGKGLLLSAQASLEIEKPEDAVRLLRSRHAELPQPLGDLALGEAFEAMSDFRSAAQFYQRVYFVYPSTDAAAKAGSALDRLKAKLGSEYPPPSAGQMLERADKWFSAREYTQARKEYSALTATLIGPERDRARVRIGAVDYQRLQTSDAAAYLAALEVEDAEADAERLYYLAECRRRQSDDEALRSVLDRLERTYPRSRWRLKALISIANKHLLANEPEKFEPLYRACYEAFPSEPEAAVCHWKVTWSSYLQRRKEAEGLLREHLLRFPASVHASGALYYLGRLAEGSKDYSPARAFYAQIAERYPSYYYGLLARDRMSQPNLIKAAPSIQANQFLASVAFPPRRSPSTYERTDATAWRIDRAGLLESAGLAELAVAELRFGAKLDGQPHLIAVELARTADSPFQALRHMKSLVSDYFSMTLDQAPEHFWEYLFPLPYRDDLVRTTGATDLDPSLVAGLIRQESEFNPRAVSPRKALGLTQVRPSTGRELARRAGIRGFSTGMLYQPATNLRLGTIYLRALLDQWGGKWEHTLASYNAGKGRVVEWIKWGDFREPSEFVETIPFTETRDYVQSVLRNAAIYKRLYGARLTAEAVTTPVTTPAAVKPVKRPARSSRKG